MVCNFTKQKMLSAGILFMCTLSIALPAVAANSAKIPMPARTIERGQIIASSDLVLTDVGQTRLPKDALFEKDPLIGMEALRTLRPGRPIQEAYVRTPPAARSGENVTIAFRVQNLAVQATGRALEDGNKGDTIRVMNNASNTVIEAEVMGSGTVRVR